MCLEKAILMHTTGSSPHILLFIPIAWLRNKVSMCYFSLQEIN